MLKGPCQPRDHNFRQISFGKKLRRFNPEWFKEHGSWLEYSILKHAAYCFCCYLMKEHAAGGDAFVVSGYTNWKDKTEKFKVHIGGPNSAHNVASRKCQSLMNKKQSIEVATAKQTDQAKMDYRTQLTGTIKCIRLLLRQGWAFRGHDETDLSDNRGNFLEILDFLADNNESFDKVLRGARKNLKLVAPNIQKDIVNAAASETTSAILNDIGDDFFAILIDESRDISVKEQMSIVLRYVDKKGCVVERFLGLVHILNTASLSLKNALETTFAQHGLCLSRIRGQGYDGASNMQGEFNGLKSLILRENECAYFIHCFAHQLQLALVAVANKQHEIELFFNSISSLSNIVGASCKRKEILQESHIIKISESLLSGELCSGRGLNQERSLKRAGDTRWSSHYNALISLVAMFPSVVDVLEVVVKDGTKQRGETSLLLHMIQRFEFVFTLIMMKNILGVTNELSQALQRSDQDIVNAMTLVKVSKKRLQSMREEGWISLLDDASLFCSKNNIDVPKMDDQFIPFGRSKRNIQQIGNLHHFQVELFYQVIDRQLQELDNRFTETTTRLLLCVSCLSPKDLFGAFDKDKLLELAKLYPRDFSSTDLLMLESQLENYIIDV